MKHKMKFKYLGLALLGALAVVAVLACHNALEALFTGGVSMALAPLAVTEEQLQEWRALMGDIKSDLPSLKGLPQACQTLREEHSGLERQLKEVQKQLLESPGAAQPRVRQRGCVSEGCARELAAAYIIHCARSDKLEALCSAPSQRDALLSTARSTLGMSTRAALTANEIPLPAQYSSELRELISEFGVVRRRMAPYPIGLGTTRPARMGTRPAFGSISMSAAISEKTPAFGFASLESHKIGGIVRLPRELDEQSIVPMGQFLARYGAVEFARAEDIWGFLADGSANYEQVKGVVQIARDNNKMVALAAGKTKPSDATLDDFRALRRQVNKAALNGRLSAYYLDSTWETRLGGFRTAAEPNVYQRLPDGTAILDGYPIVWTDVLEPYGTNASADKAIAVFGALSFWWFGEHGSPRIDTSEHVWFANDQLAVRFIEEIDFDYAAVDAAAVLTTAAA
jgi:HK97 family phage major capsid protein